MPEYLIPGGAYVEVDTSLREVLVPGGAYVVGPYQLVVTTFQYLIPGGAFVYEDTDRRSFLIPGGEYLNETAVGAGSALNFATPWVE